ncbi:hypothetical protein HYS03_01305 [Candidatus Woesebacteria bacterium]|nr:hypothetical protein [Candidatus Woesebacteria bacterium]QQG47296.1 MAG: hypothetical protein HY044_04185 [Candidatus Woesebacteria bacterium]
MRKEVVFAILAGSIIGIVVAFGAYRLNLSFQKKNENIASQEPTNPNSPTSSPTPEEFKIVLAKPQNYDVLLNSNYAISGITKPNVYVVAFDTDDEYITRSDGNGVFEIKAQLNSGANEVKIVAIDDSGKSSQTKITLVYSQDFADEFSKDQIASTSATKIQKPISFIGTITDIAENTIQIKTLEQKIDQVLVDPKNTTFVKTLDSSSKAITQEDVAIGDFVIALGFIQDNNVLKTQKLIISSLIKEVKDEVLLVQLQNLTTTLTAKDIQNGETVNIKAGKNISFSSNIKNTKITRLSDLDTNQTILVVGIKDSTGNFVARRLHLIK